VERDRPSTTKPKHLDIPGAFYREEARRSIPQEVMEDAIASSVDLRPVVELSMAQMEFACEQNIEMRPI
jgi:hypothetical protein